MIVLLLFLYPGDRCQPLVWHRPDQGRAADPGGVALGALAFNHVEFTVTTSIILGSVPAGWIVGRSVVPRAG
jgi:hypothetical protein